MNKIILNIGGEDREFRFGLGFIGNLLDSENISMNEIDGKLAENPFKWIPLIMYHSCAYAVKRTGNIPLFDSEDVADWIDESGGMASESVTAFFKAFNESLTKNVPEDKSKKKVTGK